MPRLVLVLLAASLAGAAPPEDYRVDGDHPRLLLQARRLKLLRRERDRDSERWRQLAQLLTGGVRMNEPGFAQALYYQVSGDEATGRRAVRWAVDDASADLRQVALVYDWCQPLLAEADAAALRRKLEAGLAAVPPVQTATQARDVVFAAVALGGHTATMPEKRLAEVIDDWWEKRMAGVLESEAASIPHHEFHALYEMMHAVRDNVRIDLRESAKGYFKGLPAYHVLSHYPQPYSVDGESYRMPCTHDAGEPELRALALSRAAGLAMAAFDTNALESQFLQGWLTRDRYTMHGAFGAPYEFLWANPYQPGLSVYHMPLYWHDKTRGWLFIRSGWPDESEWFGYWEGRLQRFSGGRIEASAIGKLKFPLNLGDITIVGEVPRFEISHSDESGKGKTVFVLGLKPQRRYSVSVTGREAREEESDRTGILELLVPAGNSVTVRLKEIPKGAGGG